MEPLLSYSFSFLFSIAVGVAAWFISKGYPIIVRETNDPSISDKERTDREKKNEANNKQKNYISLVITINSVVVTFILTLLITSMSSINKLENTLENSWAMIFNDDDEDTKNIGQIFVTYRKIVKHMKEEKEDDFEKLHRTEYVSKRIKVLLEEMKERSYLVAGNEMKSAMRELYPLAKSSLVAVNLGGTCTFFDDLEYLKANQNLSRRIKSSKIGIDKANLYGYMTDGFIFIRIFLYNTATPIEIRRNNCQLQIVNEKEMIEEIQSLCDSLPNMIAVLVNTSKINVEPKDFIVIDRSRITSEGVISHGNKISAQNISFGSDQRVVRKVNEWLKQVLARVDRDNIVADSEAKRTYQYDLLSKYRESLNWGVMGP